MYADAAEFCDDKLVLREFFCPHCAHLLATEVARQNDEIFCDIMIDPDPAHLPDELET